MNLICNKNRNSNVVHITSMLGSLWPWILGWLEKNERKKKRLIGKVSPASDMTSPLEMFRYCENRIKKALPPTSSWGLPGTFNYINSSLHFRCQRKCLLFLMKKTDGNRVGWWVTSACVMRDQEISVLVISWKSNRCKK